jgi:hypothetical protein
VDQPLALDGIIFVLVILVAFHYLLLTFLDIFISYGASSKSVWRILYKVFQGVEF